MLRLTAWDDDRDDLVRSLESEPAARQAFRRLREARSDGEGWADLTALDGRGRLTHLAWFGRDPRTDAAVDRSPDRRRRLFHNRPKALAVTVDGAVG